MNEWLGVRTENIVCVSDALLLIDYTLDDLVRDSILMMNFSQGGLTYQNLCDMPFNEYQIYHRELCKIQQQLENPKKEDTNG